MTKVTGLRTPIMMNKIVVMYQSKYGATKKYAEWLSKELSCDVIETKKAKVEDILAYDTIVLGGGTLCKMLKKAVAKKKPSEYEPWESALMEVIGSNHDWTDKKELKPLLEYVGK